MLRALLTAAALLGFGIAALSGDAIGAEKPTLDQLRAACVDRQGAAIDYTVEHSRHLNRANEGLLRNCEFLADQLTKTEAPPPPPPPPPVADLKLTTKPVNIGALVLVDHFYHPRCFERYDRSEAEDIITGDVWRSDGTDGLYLCSLNQAAGGAAAPWGHPTFAIEISGREVARVNIPAGHTGSLVKIEGGARIPADLADDWHMVKVVAYSATGERIDLGARNPDNWLVIDRKGGAKALDYFVIQSRSYEYVRTGGRAHSWVKVPKSAIAARPVPLAPRAFVPFDTAVPKDRIWRHDLLPTRYENVHRPVVTESGVTVAIERQGYFYNDLWASNPVLPRIDGPRGVASLRMATSIEVSHRAGHNHIYVNYGTGVARVEQDGHVRTVVGKKHSLPTDWRDARRGVNVVEVGEWRTTPVGAADSWGFAFVPATVATNGNVPPIGGEQPHLTGPEALWTDAINNRVLKVKWSATDRLAPPVITLCQSFPGADPWSLTIGADNIAFVTLRKASVVARLDARTCERLADFVVNDSGLPIQLDTLRVAHAGGSLEQRRAAKILGPEGICLDEDGNPQVGSKVQDAIWSFDRTTGARTLRAVPPLSTAGKSFFVQVACSRGGFGPRGVVAANTWSEQGFGRPAVFLPVDANGIAKGWDFHGLGSTTEGHTGTRGGIYTAAVGFGPGFMVNSTSQEGLEIYSQRLPSDTMPNLPLYEQGRSEYVAKHYRLIHGEDGFGFLNIPLPCNDSAAIKAYLQAHGHCR
jgi:hypothetical protein